MIYRFVHPVRAALWMPLVPFTAVTSSDCLRPLLLVILLRGSSECSHSDRTVSAEPKWVKSLFEVQALVLPCRKWTGSQATVIIPLPNVWLLLRRLGHIKSQDLLGNGQNESPLQDCLDQGSRWLVFQRLVTPGLDIYRVVDPLTFRIISVLGKL